MTAVSTILGYLLFMYIIVGEPILGVQLSRWLSRKVAADSAARTRYYQLTLLVQWVWMAMIAVILIPVEAPLAAIGLRLWKPEAWLLSAVVLALLGGAVAVMAFVPKVRAFLQQRTRPASPLHPTTAAERGWHAAALLSAAFCEGMLYLGFFWFFIERHFPGVPPLFVIVAATVIYGTSRMSTGSGELLETAFTGLALAMLYFFSGSLLLPIFVRLLFSVREIFLLKPIQPDQRGA